MYTQHHLFLFLSLSLLFLFQLLFLSLSLSPSSSLSLLLSLSLSLSLIHNSHVLRWKSVWVLRRPRGCPQSQGPSSTTERERERVSERERERSGEGEKDFNNIVICSFLSFFLTSSFLLSFSPSLSHTHSLSPRRGGLCLC